MRTCGWIICNYCTLHTPATWQQPANREDRDQCATSTDWIRNAYRCANGEKQINEQQSRFSALPPATCTSSRTLRFLSVFSLKFDVRFLSTLHTGRSVSRSVGSPQQNPIKQSAVCATDIHSSPLSPHRSRVLVFHKNSHTWGTELKSAWSSNCPPVTYVDWQRARKVIPRTLFLLRLDVSWGCAGLYSTETHPCTPQAGHGLNATLFWTEHDLW